MENGQHHLLPPNPTRRRGQSATIAVWDSKPRKEARMHLLDQIVARLVPAMCGGAVTLAAVVRKED